jgi:hypothetical protein
MKKVTDTSSYYTNEPCYTKRNTLLLDTACSLEAETVQTVVVLQSANAIRVLPHDITTAKMDRS